MAAKKSVKKFRRSGYLWYSAAGLVLYFAINLIFLNPIVFLVTALYAATFGVYGLLASWQSVVFQGDKITYNHGPFRAVTIHADDLAECRYIRVSLTASTHVLVDTIWLVDKSSNDKYGDRWNRGIPIARHGWGNHKKAVFTSLEKWLKEAPIAIDADVGQVIDYNTRS